MKSGLTNTHNEGVVHISADISRVQRDMSAIHRLITKLVCTSYRRHITILPDVHIPNKICIYCSSLEHASSKSYSI